MQDLYHQLYEEKLLPLSRPESPYDRTPNPEPQNLAKQDPTWFPLSLSPLSSSVRLLPKPRPWRSSSHDLKTPGIARIGGFQKNFRVTEGFRSLIRGFRVGDQRLFFWFLG